VNWFRAIHERSIPLFIVAAKLRADQRFFGTFGFWWQKTLRYVRFYYTQDEQTSALLAGIGIDQYIQAGDPRFDRVSQIKDNGIAMPLITDWCGQAQVLVFGSSWSQEQQVALQMHRLYPNLKIILVPHEVDQVSLQALAAGEPKAVLYSELAQNKADQSLLIMNTTGLLSSLYAWADITVVGGGFGKGIHNTLEAAVWGKPVIFGPHYQKFVEAQKLIRQGAAIACHTPDDMKSTLEKLLQTPEQREEMGHAAAQYVGTEVGATKKILQHPEFQKALKN
jgi:3-deoxy-D-manno-octulosonic-acid transferase